MQNPKLENRRSGDSAEHRILHPGTHSWWRSAETPLRDSETVSRNPKSETASGAPTWSRLHARFEAMTSRRLGAGFAPHAQSRLQTGETGAPGRWRVAALCFFILHSSFCLRTWGQYSIDWSTIDGGGGTSTGSVYEVSGTIGQPDAGTMSGGNYTLQGGFWSVIAVQTPGGPPLSVRCTATNTVLVSWPQPAEGWNLESTLELGAGSSVWTQIPPPYQTNATDIFYVEPPPATNRFYRLHKP